MKITLCGSILHFEKINEVNSKLQKMGFETYMPIKAEGFDYKNSTPEQAALNKLTHDFISEHFTKISKSDAILVVNEMKNGIENYIGANTLLEIGVAHFLKKRIYILNSLPEQNYFKAELLGMQPRFLNGNIDEINL